MSDIVERLRVGTTCSDEEMNKRHEAADEIERLREALVTLKSQLEERGKEIDRLFDEIVSLEAGENI